MKLINQNFFFVFQTKHLDVFWGTYLSSGTLPDSEIWGKLDPWASRVTAPPVGENMENKVLRISDNWLWNFTQWQRTVRKSARESIPITSLPRWKPAPLSFVRRKEQSLLLPRRRSVGACTETRQRAYVPPADQLLTSVPTGCAAAGESVSEWKSPRFSAGKKNHYVE